MVVLLKHLWVAGITVGPFIFIRKKSDSYVVRTHEMIHYKQQKELLFVFAYLWYALEFVVRLIQYGNRLDAYCNVSFEREAYEMQENVVYPNIRKPFSFLKYL